MKKIFIFLILLLFFVPTITKANVITYKEETTINSVDYVEGTNYGYITTLNTLDKTIISSYKDKELISEKQFDIITNINSINYNNQIIVAGIKPNGFLTIHYLDENLRINNTIETTITASSISKIRLYTTNNKLYLLLTTDDYLLIDNNIYEIDESYNINTKLFASLTQEELLSILKSDYFAIKNTYQTIENETYYYNKSTYDRNYNVIAGYKEDSIFNKHNIITIFDALRNQNTITISENILDIKLINNKIITLVEKDLIYQIHTYSTEGNLEEKIDIINGKYFTTISNNLVTISETALTYYEYDCTVNIYDGAYGTVNITENPEPYQVVDINVVANSGYALSELKIVDTDGNEIEVINNQFTMPNKSVYVTPTYTSNVVNPETADTVLILVAFTLLVMFVWKKVYKKYLWLK